MRRSAKLTQISSWVRKQLNHGQHDQCLTSGVAREHLVGSQATAALHKSLQGPVRQASRATLEWYKKQRGGEEQGCTERR